MNDSYQPIACDLYDYLEIACLHHYHLRIELIDGSELEAEAVTTAINASKEEFFVVRGPDGEQRLRMDRLLAITALDAGASFTRVLLNNARC